MGKITGGLDDKLHWYKDAIIYELHIKAFRDGSGDGIGDFKGLLEKLDYLQELAVTAIWLLPFYPSPLKDDGYDIADYYTINPRYGDIEQFKQFLDEAHKRNLKVITELVINHTSDQHPWFQRARKAPKGSPERNYYVWTDDPNQYKDVRIIFQDFETSNWTWDPVAQQYYWHRFFHHQPDLNYDSEEVQDEIIKILDFWCEMGVDGFRLDAVPYLFEREGTNGENLPETHTYLKKLRRHIDEKYPGTCFLAEANMWPEDSASYFGNGDECHMNYHFPVMPRMFMALQQEDRYPITDIFDQTPPIPENCQWAIFLRNHDELTLEMVTDEERDFMYKVYAKDPKAKINLGIRHRLAPLMDNNRRKIELMNSLLFALPGTPVIYYGDEIGMGDNFYLGDRDGVRTPMQWSADRNGGFSETNPQKLYLPVILDPEYHYEAINVEMQRRNTSSLFWFMKRMINMRKNYKAFSRGDMKFLHAENSKILAFTRTYEDEVLLIVVNLSKYPQPAEIDLREFKGYIPVELYSKNKFPSIRDDRPYFFTLDAHSFQWFLLQKTASEDGRMKPFTNVDLSEWENITENSTKKILEQELLPAYLSQRKWFKGKGRTIYSTEITDYVKIPLGEKHAYIAQVEVAFESGLPQNYLIGLMTLTGKDARKITANHPEAVICPLQSGGTEAVLCDAFYVTALHAELFKRMTYQSQVKGNKGNLVFKGSSELPNYDQEHEGISRMHTGDKHNTTIIFGNAYFLKMYRRIEPTVHPDVEINQFLNKDVKFPYIPDVSGSIEWHNEAQFAVIGMMQALIENHGDGRSYMMERVNNFIERLLAGKDVTPDKFQFKGLLTDPVSFDALSPLVQELLGNRTVERATLIGIRTADLHKALASGTTKEFMPEEFSLHYQRSLFASMQSLVRETWNHLEKHKKQLPEENRALADDILSQRSKLLEQLKRIYSKKLDIVKTRIHGNYSLRKVIHTGRDIMIRDFAGDPNRSYSERRLKRSPLLDIADMCISFYYVAYEAFLTNDQFPRQQLHDLLPYAMEWANYITAFFRTAYLEEVKDTAFIPREKDDLEMLLETLLLEKAIVFLNHELKTRPEYAIVPLSIISFILKEEQVHQH